MITFQQKLEALINENSMENGSNTPDFILAEFLIHCLATFDKVTKQRDEWYGVKLEPGRIPEEKWRRIADRIWQDQDMQTEEMDV